MVDAIILEYEELATITEKVELELGAINDITATIAKAAGEKFSAWDEKMGAVVQSGHHLAGTNLEDNKVSEGVGLDVKVFGKTGLIMNSKTGLIMNRRK